MSGNPRRSGTLQFWPRKRARKILPSVNWKGLSKEGGGLMGFMCYKVGMISVYVKDSTEHSMTKNKRIVVPATVLECPKMKIFSVRFYKDGVVVKDVVVSNEKNLKRKVSVPKEVKKIGDVKDLDYDDLRVIVYSSLAKKPNMIEIGLSGSKDDKLKLITEKVGKDISINEIFTDGLVDIRGVTIGRGLQGPIKRHGISLKVKKSEKGQRRPGNIAPWNPSRVTFRAPMAGQVGFFSRVVYNSLVLQTGDGKDINKQEGFHKYGKIKGDYIILKGSVQGPKKRVVLLTSAMRPSKYQLKKKFEVLELR